MRRRTMLFMPGNNPGMLIHADVHGADGVIFDLEDAVPPGEKDAARILVKNALKSMAYASDRLVRINDISTPYWRDDLDAVVPQGPDTLVLPKCERPEDIRTLDGYVTAIEEKSGLPAGIITFMCLIETALGVRNGYEIATASGRVESLSLGAIDLTFDLGTELSETGEEMLYSRAKMLLDAKAAGVYAYDTSYPNVENIEGLIYWTKYCKQLGYDGRPVISPGHVDIVNRIFSPSEEEIAYSKEVLAATEEGRKLGKGAVTLRGKLLDAPHIKRARQILAMAEKMSGGERS